MLSAVQLFRSCNSEQFSDVGFGSSEGAAAGWTDASGRWGGKGAAGVKFALWSLAVVGRKGVGYSFMNLCVAELLGGLGVRRGCVGEMETLDISLLMGMMSGFHPLCFVPGSWLNPVLVPEEGPSAVTEPLSVRRRCQVPPPHGRASPGGAEPAPRGKRGSAGPAEPSPPHFPLCNRIKTPRQSLALVLSLT